MKILNAIHAQGMGGVDQVFRNYNEILQKNGHDLALLISNNEYNNYGDCKIFKLKNFSPIFDFFHLLLIIFKFKPDVILCHSNRMMKWMRFTKFLSIKSVAINHGISFKSSLNCDYIISINQEIANLVDAVGFDKSKSFVLPNVIKITEKYLEKKIKNPLVIGIYGRIEKRKGFDILFSAVEILAKKKYDFCLKIGGFEVHQNYNWKSLKNLAKNHNILEKCQFYGAVLDKKKFFEDIDMLCVPSREEPFGLVILEGFLFSTLVISSDTDGGKFLISDNKNGFLFKNGDAKDLAEKIEKALSNKDNYCDLTREAFKRIENEFSLESLSQNFSKILSSII
jgi:glycosyltransferase involved in cell wall biosynthesis